MPTPALSIIRAYTHARAREGDAHLVRVLRVFCTKLPEFEPKQARNCRILQKNALFCAEVAEKSCNTAIFAL